MCPDHSTHSAGIQSSRRTVGLSRNSKQTGAGSHPGLSRGIQSNKLSTVLFSSPVPSPPSQRIFSLAQGWDLSCQNSLSPRCPACRKAGLQITGAAWSYPPGRFPQRQQEQRSAGTQVWHPKLLQPAPQGSVSICSGRLGTPGWRVPADAPQAHVDAQVKQSWALSHALCKDTS